MDGEDLGLLDNSGTGGGDEGGSGGGDESFIEEVPLGDEGAGEGAEGGEGAGEGKGEGGEGGERSQAIVKLEPLAIRKALREITTANPEFAKKFPTLEKAVTTALYKSGQIEKFGGLQAVSEALEALEVHGGVEGIQELADEIVVTRELEKGFERGDPAVIDGWAKDYPSGFKKLIVPALEKLEKLDEAHFEAVSSHLASKIFERCGVFSVFAKLGEALATLGKDQDGGATKQFNDIAKFLTDMKTLAGKARGGHSDRDAELDQRETEIADRDKKAFYGSVRADVNTQVMSEMNRLIRLSLPAGKKIKVETANRLRKEINAELMRIVNAKSGYADKYESVMNARNKDRAVRFIVSNARADLPKVVKQLLKEFNLMGPAGSGGNNTQRRVNGAGGSGGGGGSSTAFGRPKTADVDFTRTDKAVWLSSINAGKATGPIFLKTGKQAKW